MDQIARWVPPRPCRVRRCSGRRSASLSRTSDKVWICAVVASHSPHRRGEFRLLPGELVGRGGETLGKVLGPPFLLRHRERAFPAARPAGVRMPSGESAASSQNGAVSATTSAAAARPRVYRAGANGTTTAGGR